MRMIPKECRRITLFSLLLFAPAVPAGEPVVVPGYQRGPLIAGETFSDGLDHWLAEGGIVARIREGKLLLESRKPGADNPKGNLWWRKEFREPYLIQFDYQSLSSNGLTMVFWNAHGIDGKEIFSWKRSGKYTEYVSGNLRAYHLSFHRFGSGLSNIRKAPGFHLLSAAKDPVAPDDRRVHRFRIVVTGKRHRVFVDGRLLHDILDDGKPCLNRHPWQHPLPCPGTGPASMHGAFGIRVTQRQKALFDNVQAYTLVAAERPPGEAR